MKNIRVFYKKKSLLKFISHLDMNRFMKRMMRKTKIPAWYTEGFNTHLYIAFALPLSLGFESDYEIMDFKVIDDEYPLSEISNEMKRVMPEYLEIISVDEPILKVADIAFAQFEVTFNEEGISNIISEFLSSKEILCRKKNKKGQFITVDLVPKIKSYSLDENGKTVLTVVVPAGSRENINPAKLLEVMEESNNRHFGCNINRTGIFNSEMKLFK